MVLGIRLPHKSNIEAFVLQHKVGQGNAPEAFETVQEFPYEEYKHAPPYQDVADQCDEGETYQMAIKFANHDTPVPDRRLGGWIRRVKSASGKAPKTDVGKQISESVQPLTEMFTAMGSLRSAMEGFFYGPAAENGGEPNAAGESLPTQKLTALQQLKGQLEEVSTFIEAAERIRFGGAPYDRSNPYNGIAPLNFSGNAPWWMHPIVANYSKDFIKDVLGQLGDTAYEFGHKFRMGINGQPNGSGGSSSKGGGGGTPETTSEETKKIIMEGGDKQWNDAVSKLNALKAKPVGKKKAAQQEEEQQQAQTPTPPDSTPLVQPQILEIKEPVPT